MSINVPSDALASLPPIPWAYSDSPGVLLWTWVTEHFVATIRGSQAAIDPALAGGADRVVRSYSWELADVMRRQQGMPRILVEGECGQFAEAEALIREHVGKAYDPRLGYQHFAGPYATTFTIADGSHVDAADLIGIRCTATVLLAGGAREMVSGDLTVHHYTWRLRDGDDIFEIAPEHVVELRHRSVAADKAAALIDMPTYTGIGRLHRDEWRRGCTGAAGFDFGTVDHAGCPRCPLHEPSLPDEMLR